MHSRRPFLKLAVASVAYAAAPTDMSMRVHALSSHSLIVKILWMTCLGKEVPALSQQPDELHRWRNQPHREQIAIKRCTT